MTLRRWRVVEIDRGRMDDHYYRGPVERACWTRRGAERWAARVNRALTIPGSRPMVGVLDLRAPVDSA